MKSLILPIVFLFATLALHSQTIDYVEFDYDDAGNRTTRQVIYLKSQQADDLQQLKESAYEQVMDSVEFKGTLGKQEIIIYPNPTKGSLSIAIAGEEKTGPATLVLFSLTGEVILQQEIRQPHTTLDLAGHLPGTYLLNISSAAGQRSWKIIKE